MSTSYVILEAADALALEALVREHLYAGWTCVGGPFIFPWAPGHGYVHAMPEGTHVDGWIYATICQAMTLDGSAAMRAVLPTIEAVKRSPEAE